MKRQPLKTVIRFSYKPFVTAIELPAEADGVTAYISSTASITATLKGRGWFTSAVSASANVGAVVSSSSTSGLSANITASATVNGSLKGVAYRSANATGTANVAGGIKGTA